MSANYERVLDAIRSVLPLEDLPRLLWWVGTVRPEALGRVEELGCQLGERMAEGDAGFEDALSRLTEALVLANEKRKASGDPFGPRPIWAFWTLFTRKSEPESPLSVLLREHVGYPTDEEAGMPARTGGADA